MQDKTPKNFISDEAAWWIRELLKKSTRAPCHTCTIADGCLSQCTNAATFYECNDITCKLGDERCRNRRFTELDACEEKDRGVEVVSTRDRGKGLGATRSYEALELIVEYVGEIITNAHEQENKSCLLQLSRNLYIDALRNGNDSRFVNHSCNPNCEVSIWIVHDQPRVGLFARNDISTGEEITISYNLRIRHLSTPVVCKCGSSKCSGSTGPDTRIPSRAFDNPSQQSQYMPGPTLPSKQLRRSEERIRQADNEFVELYPPSNGPTGNSSPENRTNIRSAVWGHRKGDKIVKSKFF